MKTLRTLSISLSLLFSIAALAETPVEIKLVAPIEEERGWCLDLRGGPPNAAPIGGVHGHTCYTFQGNGPSRDQAFIKENILEKNEFRMVEFNDKCMTLYEPKAGSFISLENCDGRTAQQIVFNESGTVSPKILPELCMTMGSVVLPGSGGTPLYIMRDVTFEECEPEPGVLQVWTLRSEYDGPEETTAERPFTANPNARPPGGGGMGGKRSIVLESIRILGDDVATANGSYDSMGRNDGTELHMQTTMVFVRVDGEWRIDAIRNARLPE